jgi:hypothetical protein
MPNIVWLPVRSPRQNRLTTVDRQEALTWARGVAGLWCRVVIYADPTEDEDIGDFISIYRIGQSWASWGAARRDSHILLWRSDHGVDLGSFPSVAEALQVILPSSPDIRCAAEFLPRARKARIYGGQ